MEKTNGVFFGTFLPPHRGHLTAIINAATQCETLYVVVSHNPTDLFERTNGTKVPQISLNQRVQWLSQEVSDLPHIKVVGLDETGLAPYPHAWEEWSDRLCKVVKVDINKFFVGEQEYVTKLNEHFPTAEVVVFDSTRNTMPISATEIRNNPIQHWDYILGAARPFFAKKVLIAGTESCVDADTEFFNGIEWKRIADYQEGDKVLQFNNDYTASLVLPNKYIKEPCNEMIMFHNTYNTWSQVYSEDHDLVYITSKGNLNKKKASKIKEEIINNKYGFTGKFVNWFYYNGDISIDSNKLQLMLAISADGTEHGANFWRIRLLKERKINKLREIITNIGIELDERVYADGYTNFFIPKEYGYKIFPNWFIELDKESKNTIIDNIFFWDGCEKDKRYFTTEKVNADIIQFIFNSCGIKTLFHIDSRENRKDCYSIEQSNVKYTTLDCKPDTDRSRLVESYTTKDGFKYCFNVPSHMLVLRRNNHVFITGNCGKTTLTKYLAKMYHTSWAEEVGRDYAKKFLGGNETVFTVHDFERLAYLQHECDLDALRHANRICFFDTDAVVTQYYAKLYLGQEVDMVNNFIKPENYDTVILLTPDVKWVDDGQRLNGEQQKRWELHNQLKKMYQNYGFTNIVEVSGDYSTRLWAVKEVIDNLLK